MVFRYLDDPARDEGREPRATDKVTVERGELDPSLGGYGPDAEAVKTMQKAFEMTPVPARASSFSPIELSEPARTTLDNMGSMVAFTENAGQIESHLKRIGEEKHAHGSNNGRLFSDWTEEAIGSCLLYAGKPKYTEVYVPQTYFKDINDQDRTKILKSMAHKMTQLYMRSATILIARSGLHVAHVTSVSSRSQSALSSALSDHWGLDQVYTWADGIPEGVHANDMQKSLAEQRQRIPVDFDPRDRLAGTTIVTDPWDPQGGVAIPTEIIETVDMPPVTEATVKEILAEAKAEFKSIHEHLLKVMKEQSNEQETTGICRYLARNLGGPNYKRLNEYLDNKEGDLSDCFKGYLCDWDEKSELVRDGRHVHFHESTNAFHWYEAASKSTRVPLTRQTGVKIHVANFPEDLATDWMANLKETVSDWVDSDRSDANMKEPQAVATE